MKLAIAIVLWAACGLYSWGTERADFKDVCRGCWACYSARVLLVILGPIGAILAALVSNFNQHGWQLWERR